MLDIRGRRFEPSVAPENDIVRHRIVVRHEPQNKFTGLDPQGVSPNQVTVWWDTTSSVLELRNESVVLGAHLFREVTLGQTASLP
jgi:hypothetical protein